MKLPSYTSPVAASEKSVHRERAVDADHKTFNRSMNSPMPESDLDLIRDVGVPVCPVPDFGLYGQDGRLVLNARGVRFLRVSMLMHGLNPDPFVAEVQDKEGWRLLALKVGRVRLFKAADDLEKSLNGGQVPVKARELAHALLYGSVADFHAATERRLQCEAAGENVIPATFGATAEHK
jgi:hypothetical protein